MTIMPTQEFRTRFGKEAGEEYANLHMAFEQYKASHCALEHAAEQAQPVSAEPVAWVLTDEHINDLQVASVNRVIDRCKRAHFTNIKIRINGEWEEHEADWIKHMRPASQPSHNDVLEEAYAQGWVICSRWAGRDDLIFDMDSRAYAEERDSKLRALKKGGE